MRTENTARDQEFLYTAYFEYLLDNGIQDDDVLHDFIETYLGFNVPRHVSPFCEGFHDSAFSFIADQFFERILTTFGFANRTGGKTRNVAILNITDMLFKPGVEICSAGAVKPQAQRGYQYLYDMFAGLGPLMEDRFIKLGGGEVHLTNGSRAEVITASYTGVNSPHPEKFRLDEIELIHYDIIQEALCLAAGTLVATAHGLRPIEEIETGDLVWSWSLREHSLCCMRVRWSGCTGEAATLVLALSNGEQLVCTPEHRVLCADGHYEEAQRLTPGERLLGAALPPMQPSIQDRVSAQDRPVCGLLERSQEDTPSAGLLYRLSTAARAAAERHWQAARALYRLFRHVQAEASEALLGLLETGLDADHASLCLVPGQGAARWQGPSGLPGETGAYPAPEATHARRALDVRAARFSGDHVRPLRGAWGLGARLQAAGRASGHRGAWDLLARLASFDRTRPAQEGAARSRRSAGDRGAVGPRTHVVELLRINPGPRQAVYDLTVNGTHNFVASGLVVHNSMTQTSRDESIKAQDTFTSTRKVAKGTVQRLLDERVERGITLRSWCIWETLKPCTRKCHDDPVYGSCPIYSRKDADGEHMLCGGKAHDLPEGGYYSIEDVIKKARNLDRDTWEAQWECKRPNPGQLVYGQKWRDEAPWVVQPEEAHRILERARRDGNWLRIYGLDFGSNFACGFWMRDPTDERWYKYFEYFFAAERDRSTHEHAEWIKANDPMGFNDRIPIFADPSGRQAIRDLQDDGLFAEASNNDLYGGLNHMKHQLELRPDGKPGLRYFKTCIQTRKEMGQTYVHKMDRDGTVNRDVVMDKDNHCCDADRYAHYGYMTVGTETYSRRRLRTH